MTYFDKMVKDMRNKDLDAIQDWLHPDFLFVAEYGLFALHLVVQIVSS